MNCKMKCSTVRTDCIAIMITMMFFRCLRFALLGFGFTDNHTKSKYIIVKNFLIDILIAMVYISVKIIIFKVLIIRHIVFILEKSEKFS